MLYYEFIDELPRMQLQEETKISVYIVQCTCHEQVLYELCHKCA